MKAVALMTRAKSWLEGSWRGPFFGQGHLGHWFQLGSIEDGYQRDLRVDRFGMQYIPIVAALRHLHRSAFAQLRPHHMREDERGAITDLKTSAQLRVMLTPNDYESGADFNARLADEWMTVGEVLVWGVRNDRFEVDHMHIVPRSSWQLAVDPETQSVFYAIRRGSNDLLSAAAGDFIVPQRDVMHLRWATPRHPLIGESGFAAAGLAAGINVALSNSQAAFFAQMRRPSGIIGTDAQLNSIQMTQLREAFDKQAKGMAQGGIPILGWGAKFHPMSISSEDAEVIAALRMSNEEIARCVGVPGPLVGDLEKSGLTNTEALIEFWLSLSLGGLIERYERGLSGLLGLDGRRDWVDLSTEALLRTNLVQRMEGLTKGVQGGVLAPNEARKREGLSPVAGGDQVFLQRQNTPVDLLGELAAADLKAAETPPPAPADEDDDDEESQGMSERIIAAAVEQIAQLAELQSRVNEALGRVERSTDQVRAQVAEALLELERRCAQLRDGRDGVGIRAVSGDGTTVTFEMTDDSRVECPLMPGLPGDKGDRGHPGADGLGVGAPCWEAGVYRDNSIVQHHEGRIYRARKDTADEPGDSQAWERIGRLGLRWCGPFEEHRTYEAGDLYVKGGTFHVLASGEHRCVAPKPLTPSEVRTIARKLCDEREAALRGDLAATQVDLNRTKVELTETRAEYSEAFAETRLEVEALKKVANVLRQALEDQAARASP